MWGYGVVGTDDIASLEGSGPVGMELGYGVVVTGG